MSQSEEKNVRKMIACSMLLALSLMAAVPGAAQEDRSQRPSPPAKAECRFPDGKTITVDYSSPRMRGRQIFGGLVPYGEVWRAGANEATTLVTNANLVIGGKDVPAGSYTLFTLPTASRWTLIINKQTGIWGIPYPGPASDFTRTDMSVSRLAAPLENFTISFERTGGTCTMRLDWETTRAAVNITQKN
jgi:hypothetical protein